MDEGKNRTKDAKNILISRMTASMKSALKVAVLALLLLVPFVTVQAAPGDVGIVLLHGKWGQPNSMRSLGSVLESSGYKVSIPEMAWSGRRLYDKDYPAALREIEAEVKQLRARGAKRVVVAGQSLGANAAVAYASSGLDLDALVIFAPGHFPERGMGGRAGQEGAARSKSMVAAGHGDDLDSFPDTNQGRNRTVRMTAAIHQSYFDPDGLGAMTKTIRKLPKALPILLVIGTQDPFLPESRAMFDSAPAHEASRYVVLEGDHMGMPNLVSGEMLKWLEPLAQ